MKKDTTALDKDILSQYLEIFDKSLIISETDLDGIIKYANRNFSKVSKYTPDELLGKNHNIIRHSDMPKKTFEKLWKTIKNGEIWEGLIKNRKKDGKEYYVKTIVAPIKDKDGNNIYYVAFGQDITDLVKVSNKLSLEKNLLKAILDNTNNIVIVEKNGKVYLINKTAFEKFKITSKEEFEKDYFPLIKEAKSNRLSLKDFIFQLNIKSFRFKNDAYRVYTLSDITELEKAKEKLIEEKNLKERFFANMSHEIRTPLNSIVGFTKMLEDTNLDERQKEYVEYIKQSSKFLLNIVNDILDFSKIESGNFNLNIKPNNLIKTIIETFNLLKPLADNKKIDYRLKIDLYHECFEFDEIRLKQILTNLLSNAIKFTKDKVELIVERDLTFRVVDNGPGIEKDKIKEIFEPFIQTKIGEYKGTGLGLSIVKRLVEMMNGDIDIKSEVGVGSEFYFKLPLKECDEKFLSKQIPNIYTNSKAVKEYLLAFGVKFDEDSLIKIVEEDGEIHINNFIIQKDINYLYNIYYTLVNFHLNQVKKEHYENKIDANILVVEDNEFNLKLLRDILETFDIKTDSATNGLEAIQKVKQGSYDLIFMDVNMPKMSGIEAAKIIKKMVKTPIVAITAYSFEDEIKEITKYMDDYITKPIDLEDLKDKLHKYLNNEIIRIQKEYKLSSAEIEELFRTFIKTYEELLENEKDYYRLFHQLKGSSASLKLTKLEELSRKALEDIKKFGKKDFTKEIAIVKEELNKLKSLLSKAFRV